MQIWQKRIASGFICGVSLILSTSPATSQNSPTTPPIANVRTNSLPSAQDFAARTNRDFSISPNGKKLAFLSGEGLNSYLVLFDNETGEQRDIPLGSESKLKDVSWAGNNYILITASFTYTPRSNEGRNGEKYEMYRTIAYSIATGGAKILRITDLGLNTAIPIYHIKHDAPEKLIMGGFKHDILAGSQGNFKHFLYEDGATLRLSLYELDLATGREKFVMQGKEKTNQLFVDRQGLARLRIDSDDKLRKVSIWVVEGTGWRKLVEFDDAIDLPYTIEGILSDNEALIIDEIDGVKKPQKLNLITGEKTLMYPDERRSVESVILDPFTREPVGLWFEGYVPQVKWFDAKLASAQTALERAFPGKIVYVSNWDIARNKIIVGTEGTNSLYTSYLFDMATMSAEGLSNPPESFANYNIAPRTLEKFKASDGLEIPAFVTRPIRSEGRKTPTIILPHGGPESSDSYGWDLQAQFLASRGYLVIQPQFRGSTGNGDAFASAGYGQWGGKMQSDVSESLKWGIEKGWVDPARVCIVGGSYGGYAAMQGATATPELYACAVSFAGVFDLAAMQGRASRRGSLEYWEEHMGLSRMEADKIRSISPMYNAANVRVPILLMHGKDDSVVPLEQSTRMAAALQRAGKNVKFIEFDGEDHHFSNAATRERYLVELEKFLAPILKPGE